MPDREEQRRKQAIARYLADDKIEDICKAIGGSKSWLYKWRDRYQAAVYLQLAANSYRLKTE